MSASGAQSSQSALMAKSKSRDYLELVKAIGECKVKIEEDNIVRGEILTLKERLADPKADKSKAREYLLRLLYVELLGHDAAFGHIHAVKLCSDAGLLNKRVAYLATTFFLNDQSELLILLMNTLKSDLHSDNYLIVCAALTTVCHLVAEDAIPLLLPSITELLKHPKELVRKKAMMALHRCFIKGPHLVDGYAAHCRRGLCDPDPSVMAAALCALHEAIRRDAPAFKNLVKSLLHVLTQIVDRRLPRSYDNARVPAPFIQIKLLKMLALLGQGDKESSSAMHPVILNVMRSANTGTAMGNSLVYECVTTATAIHPNKPLLTASAAMIAHFLHQPDANLKYVALDALGRIVQISSSYGVEHQMAIIDCLENPDETLKKKTLELLYKMTDPDNVEVVVEKMVAFLEGCSDDHVKADVATRIGELAERYAPDNQWFIETMCRVFELAGALVRPELAHDLMQLIAEGTGEGGAQDEELRGSAVRSLVAMAREKPKLPELLLCLVAWVVGEYGTEAVGAEEAQAVLAEVGRRQDASDTVKGYVLTALCKAGCESQASQSMEAADFVSRALASRNVDLQQRAIEMGALMSLPPAQRAGVCPQGQSCEDVDEEIAETTALDAFVNDALARGCAPYIGQDIRDDAVAPMAGTASGLRFEAYEVATQPAAAPMAIGSGLGEVRPLDALVGAAPTPPSPPGDGAPQLNISGPRKWGRPSQPPPAAPQAFEPPQATPQETPAATFADEGPAAEASFAPPDPEVSDDKRRLAASLFGGGGGRARRASRGAAGGQAASKPAAPAPQPAPEMDLLLDLAAPAPMAPAVQAAPDLMGGMGMAPTGLDALYGAPNPNPGASAPPPAMAGAGEARRPKLGEKEARPSDPFADLLG